MASDGAHHIALTYLRGSGDRESFRVRADGWVGQLLTVEILDAQRAIGRRWAWPGGADQNRGKRGWSSGSSHRILYRLEFKGLWASKHPGSGLGRAAGSPRFRQARPQCGRRSREGRPDRREANMTLPSTVRLRVFVLAAVGESAVEWRSLQFRHRPSDRAPCRTKLYSVPGYGVWSREILWGSWPAVGRRASSGQAPLPHLVLIHSQMAGSARPK